MSDPALLYPYVLDGATGMVDAAYARFTGFTNQAWALVTNAISDLGDYQLPTVPFTASFNPQLALSQFPTIAAPDAPAIVFNAPAAPTAPPAAEAVSVQLSPAPVDNTAAPVYAVPSAPTLVAVTDPGDAPVLDAITLPDAPALAFPDAPADIVLSLPDVPVIQLPTFQGARPVFNAPIPEENFAFTPEEYVSALLDKTRATISAMQDGGTGLPAAVAKALRDRATLEADNEVNRAVEESYDQFSARGFDEPNGILNARLDQVRQDARAKRAGVNRDVYIQDQQAALENLRFAVQQGIALEGTLIQAHQEQMRLALEAAKYTVDLAISILNARVSAFNAQVLAYQTDASVFRELIAAEATKLDLYKSQLEGERLKVDISESQLRRYEAQLRAVNVLVDVYKSQLEAVTTEVQLNSQKLEQYRTRVSVMSEQVRAQSIQYEGYSARVNAETAKAQFYQAATQGYAARVNAWSTAERAKLDAARFTLDNNQNRQEVWRSQLALYTAQLQTEQARIDTLVKKYGADADIYQSKARVATAAAEANNRAFQLNLAEQQALVDTELKRAELEMKQVEFIASENVEIKKAIASVGGQLTSAAMSAVNFHAGTSYSGSMNLGYNLGVNFSGSIDDGSTI